MYSDVLLSDVLLTVKQTSHRNLESFMLPRQIQHTVGSLSSRKYFLTLFSRQMMHGYNGCIIVQSAHNFDNNKEANLANFLSEERLCRMFGSRIVCQRGSTGRAHITICMDFPHNTKNICRMILSFNSYALEQSEQKDIFNFDLSHQFTTKHFIQKLK